MAFQSKIFRVKDVDVEFEDGTKQAFSIIERPDTSMIVPLTADNKVIFIREYQAGINAYHLGLPKGRIDAGENATEAANRELQEETGYKASQLDALGIFTISPAHLTQRTHVFLARDLSESRLSGDEMHELEIVEYPLKDFEKLIDDKKLNEARMIAALYLAARFLGQQL